MPIQTPKDVVRAWVDAMNRGDVEAAMAMLTADATIVGPAPEPLTRDEFAAIHYALSRAIPDWNFHARDYRERGEDVLVRFEITGTHTGDLLLPLGNAPKIAATGKPIRQPLEEPIFSVSDGRITALRLPHVAGGGVGGILAQIGAPLPAKARTERVSAPSYP